MKKLILLFCLTLVGYYAIGQTRVGSHKSKITPKAENSKPSIIVDTTYTTAEMVEDFFDGTCVEVSNINSIGQSKASGLFWADQTSLGIPAGMIITTGSAIFAEGPNIGEGTGGPNGGSTDPALYSLGKGAPIYDASGISFDIVSSQAVLEFYYIFGSDEYPEYTCSGYNDVFGFFVDGPGITKNVALIPNTETPVKINNINSGVVGDAGNIANCTPPDGTLAYSSFYVSNPIGSQEIEYDGYTIPISSKFTVIPGELYHVKLIIGDVSDNIYDSGILIGFNSLCADSLFNPKKVLASAKKTGSSKFLFAGQAKYATSYKWDFGDDTGSNLKNPGEHTYAQEGEFSVTFIASNFCCSDTSFIKVKVQSTVVNVNSEEIPPICNQDCNGTINLDISGGTEPYQIKWSNGNTGVSQTGLCAGTYTVTVIDAEGYQNISGFELKDPEPIQINVFQTSKIDGPIVTTVSVTGGTPPYLYKWSDGKYTQSRNDLKQGVGYAVKVTDKNGCFNEYSKVGKLGATVKFKAGFNNKINVRELVIMPYNLENTKAEIRVFNTMGQALWNHSISSEQEISIDTRNWTSGIYYIQMITQEGVEQKSVFIK